MSGAGDSEGMVAIAVILVAAAYVLSSGVVFVVMYKVGRRFPSQLASIIYWPLDALAPRWRSFGDWYTAFHWWMYRRFVDDSPMPPPPGGR